MRIQDFILYPFPKNDHNGLTASGTICRDDVILSMTCELSGLLDWIHIPDPDNMPRRKSRLWQSTCFEFFLKANHTKSYWEFNLSPSGHWNVYRFDDYREGMAEEIAFSKLPFTVTHKPDSLRIDLKVNLEKILPANPPLLVGISAVICDKNGGLAYWALTHPASKPDFHHPAGFVLEL